MKSITLILVFFAVISCSKSDKPPVESPKKVVQADDPMSNIGIGPIKESFALPTNIDNSLVAKGKDIYDKMCAACHKPTEKFIGPAPKGIFERRNPAWVMNMILNPNEMILKDPIAKKLLMESNMAQMANQNLKEDEARAILEYFRTL